MRTTKVLSVTLPDEMLEQAKRRAKLENRTMSELVREALRQYEWSKLMQEIRKEADERVAAGQGMTEEEVVKLIHEFRAEQRAEAAAAEKARKAS